MTRFSKDSKYRLRDFRRRGGWKLQSCEIYTHPVLFQDYIPIHPFGDEEIILKKLKMLKENCTWIDAYWDMGNDVSFLRVITKELSNVKSIGMYAQWGSAIKEYLTLTAIVKQSYITREVFEECMESFVNLDIIPSEQLRSKLKNKNLKL